MDLNKNFLLPHKWQVVGGWIIIAAILISMVNIACDINGVFHIPAILGWIPAFLGLLLMCLSQEKVDDEYISNLRGRLVCIIVVVAFIGKFLQYSADLLRICYGWYSTGIAIFLLFLNSPIFLGAIYIITLKLTLYIINRKVNRYAEQ